MRFTVRSHAMWLSSLICLVATLAIVNNTMAQDDNPDSGHSIRIFLPWVSANQSPGSEAIQPEQQDTTNAEAPSDENVYSSEGLHFSFSYPSDWSIQPQSIEAVYGQVIVIDGPKEQENTLSRIEITVQSFEIDESESLEDWAKSIHQLSNYLNPERTDSTMSTSITTSEEWVKQWGSNNILHVSTQAEGYGVIGQTVYIRKGRLVYLIQAYDDSSATQKAIQTIATSMQFEPDSPSTLSELTGNQVTGQSPDEIIEYLEQQRAKADPCDIVCKDAKSASEIPTVTPEPLSPEVLEAERQYWENMDTYEELKLQSQAHALTTQVEASELNVSGQQKALPPNWRSPVTAASGTSIPVNCGSGGHINQAEFAVDAQVGIGTSVYASQSGNVVASYYDNNYVWTGSAYTSYGNLILIETSVGMADEIRYYYHAYAHLDYRLVNQSSYVSQWGLIGASGNTGNVSAHLHFHIRDVNNNPVDASPILGFQPNLNYPSNFATCGYIYPVNQAPIIIDAVAFAQRVQGRRNRYWFCYTGGHINECHLDSVPNEYDLLEVNSTTYDPQSPRVDYGIYVPQTASYRVWVCGNGGSGSADSLHMGNDVYAQTSSVRMTGYDQNAWVWQSVKMDGNIPYLYLTAGYHTINFWMREDGMKVNRIVLMPNWSSSPSNIRCGSY